MDNNRYSLFIKVKIHSEPTYLVGCAISSQVSPKFMTRTTGREMEKLGSFWSSMPWPLTDAICQMHYPEAMIEVKPKKVNHHALTFVALEQGWNNFVFATRTLNWEYVKEDYPWKNKNDAFSKHQDFYNKPTRVIFKFASL